MTRKQLIIPMVTSASRASGNSGDIADAASFKRLVIFLNVTVAPGTSLDLAVDMKDPQSLNYVPVQTRFAGRNINGVLTIGDWTLGAFRQMLAADGVPYTECRVLGDQEVVSSRIRLRWTVVGAQPTFSISITGDTEEGS